MNEQHAIADRRRCGELREFAYNHLTNKHKRKIWTCTYFTPNFTFLTLFTLGKSWMSVRVRMRWDSNMRMLCQISIQEWTIEILSMYFMDKQTEDQKTYGSCPREDPLHCCLVQNLRSYIFPKNKVKLASLNISFCVQILDIVLSLWVLSGIL